MTIYINGFEWKGVLEPNPEKIVSTCTSSGGSTMTHEGYYPQGTTPEQVQETVNGTFGGRFEKFADGYFKFIAYTD